MSEGFDKRRRGPLTAVLVAPRRYGKTSLLGRVADDLEDTVTVVLFDLYEVRSWADLAGRLSAGLRSVTGSGRARLAGSPPPWT